MKKAIGLMMVAAMVCSAASAETVTFQNGVNDYQGNADSTVRSNKLNTNFGAYKDVVVDWESSTENFNGLSYWDFGSVPSGLTITSAKLKLYARSLQGTADRTISVYAMLQPVNMGNKNAATASDGEVCWQDRAYNVAAWGNDTHNGPVAGVDYTTTDGTSLVLNPSTDNGTWVEFDVTDIVNAWYAGTLTNNGFVLIGASSYTSDCRSNFASANTDMGDQYRPILEITYTPEPATMGLLLIGGGLAFLRRRSR